MSPQLTTMRHRYLATLIIVILLGLTWLLYGPNAPTPTPAPTHAPTPSPTTAPTHAPTPAQTRSDVTHACAVAVTPAKPEPIVSEKITQDLEPPAWVILGMTRCDKNYRHLCCLHILNQWPLVQYIRFKIKIFNFITILRKYIGYRLYRLLCEKRLEIFNYKTCETGRVPKLVDN